jgi:hypothetical protein
LELEDIPLPNFSHDSNSDSDSDIDEEENMGAKENPNCLWDQGQQGGKEALRQEREKKAKRMGKGKAKEGSLTEHSYGHFSTTHKIAVGEMVERHVAEIMEYCQANNLDPTKVWKHADGKLPNHTTSAWQAFQQCRGCH